MNHISTVMNTYSNNEYNTYSVITSGQWCTCTENICSSYYYYADNFSIPPQEVKEDMPIVINGLDYSAVMCSDGGLKCLSQRLQSKGVTNIGRCLGLDESFVQRIEEDTTLDDQHKMHQLLKEWKHSKDPATWGMLAHSLRSQEDASLMEKLTQAASEEQNPEDQGMVA